MKYIIVPEVELTNELINYSTSGHSDQVRRIENQDSCVLEFDETDPINKMAYKDFIWYSKIEIASEIEGLEGN